ncbi:hypothetical protein C6P46_002501 [Rhodotorula mucilaginosa]|uniref:Uncharacterized protein n=1 Tax=Rhodotorula mucilaginosa TaxID=5537 RepID=A0A9P6VTN4_RHOMI|nr:hypothetical protein C6P46_002501 [Rhodotorula mucilaginosa]
MPRLPASLGSWTARARPHAVAAVAPSLVSSAFHSSANAPSHVGSAAIPVPSTVTIQLPSLAAVAPGATPAQAIVKGPKGQLAVELASFVRLTQQQQQQQGTEGQAPILDHFVVDIENPAVKHQRAVWGLTRALLANAVVGVSEGYTLPIRLVGVGYRATVEDIPPSSRTNHSGPQPTQRLNLKLGFAHPVLIDLPPDVTATTPAPNAIALSGIDKQRLGQGKGIFVGDEQLPYIICTAVLILLNIGPLVWQFKQGNSGPIAMGVWIMVGSIHELINTTVWYGDAADRAPIWCDISVKVAIGQQIGRVASVYCIARFLADIVSPRATAITRSDRRRRAIYDYSISFGLPAILMAGSVLYQPYRYRIVHGLGFGGMLYSALCVAYLCVGIPLAFVSAYQYINTAGTYADYSWTYMRSGWSVYGIPTSEDLTVADFSNWSNVVVASLFFAAFGFGSESSAALRKNVKVRTLNPGHDDLLKEVASV